MSESTQHAGAERITGPPTPDGTRSGDAERADDVDCEELISKDDLFHLLQNGRRRAVVRYLQGRDGPVRMRDVAEQVAAWEHDTTLEALTSKQRQRVYIALYQSHLDTLADAGVIDYNKPRGVVEPRPRLEDVARYVDADAVPDTEEPDVAWERRYLGVSVASSLLLVGTAVDATVFQFLSTFAASAIVLMMFSLLTLLKVFVDSNGGRWSASA